MNIKADFTKYLAKSSVGLVFVSGLRNKFTVGPEVIDVDNYEVAIIDRLMIISPFLPKGFEAEDMARSIGFVSVEAFEKKFQSLMDKLSQYAIANRGGNGSYYEGTIFADDLFSDRGGRYAFNRPLAGIVGWTPYLSDETLSKISYQPRSYKPKGLVL